MAFSCKSKLLWLSQQMAAEIAPLLPFHNKEVFIDIMVYITLCLRLAQISNSICRLLSQCCWLFWGRGLFGQRSLKTKQILQNASVCVNPIFESIKMQHRCLSLLWDICYVCQVSFYDLKHFRNLHFTLINLIATEKHLHN